MPEDLAVETAQDGVQTAPEGSGAQGVQDSQSGDAASASSPADAEFLKRLESLDPAGLPEPLRRRLELPFNQEFTRKSQQQSELQNKTLAVLDRLTERLNSQGQQPTESQRKLLVEKIVQGDLSAIDQLLDTAIQERVKPIENAQALRDAVEQAQTLHPYVKTKEIEIAKIIASDATLKAMATADNFRYAPQVLAGLAIQLENAELKGKIADIPKMVAEAKKAGVEEFKKSGVGLPASTTRAGTTSGKSAGQAPPKTFSDAGLAAWIALGNSPDTYR